MLFVHGAGGGGWEWNVWARMFAADGLVVHAPDLQAASGGLAQTRLGHYSEQVRTHVEALRRKPAGHADPKIVLVGASLGGLLALMNADRADALVLINPIPPAPLSRELPRVKDHPAIIRWGANATLEGTRRALPDADEFACLHAFRRWRDESGVAMNAAWAGVVVPKLNLPALLIASGGDKDIPCTISAALAQALDVRFHLLADAGHVGPLLGRQAHVAAAFALDWLNGYMQKI